MFNWKQHYEDTHTSFPGMCRKPVIAITGNFGEKGCELAEGYYESVLRAGGAPLVVPPTADADALVSLLERVDGLILSGGGDMNPLYVGEEPHPSLGGINPRRDLSELLLIRLAYDRQVPMLGICRGIQMLAAALDGRVWQDLGLMPAANATARLQHSQDLERTQASHTVLVERGSLLERIYGQETGKGTNEDALMQLFVNSFHHQAVREAGPRLRVSAIAPDGVIEAVESAEHKSIVGVQWHPECFCLRGDESHLPLFRWLVAEAGNYAEARRVHERILTLDSHCDTPMFFSEGIHFEQRDSKILVDLHKMTEGHLDASVMVAYLPQGERTPKGHAAATAQADSLLTQIEQMVAANKEYVDIARTPADLYRLKHEGRKAIMMGIENGYAIGHDLENLHRFTERGIVYMTLCHNGNNDICGSARYNDEQLGVSPFGVEVIQEMNRLGVMVDLSHGGERSFYDALDISCQPIVCSHSSARALCDHPRNLTDDQMRVLAQHGGVAQVTFYGGFLRREGTASIEDAVAHLNHMVRVMGIEHVGIGTDFDGDGGVPGLASASELMNFTRRLLREHYNEEDLRLIWGGNFLRVMEQVQQARVKKI